MVDETGDAPERKPQWPIPFGPMTPADYLCIVVLPTLAEFMDKPDDRRRLYLACIATAHMVDHVARSIRGRNAQNAVRKEVSRQGEHAVACLTVVEGVCNGAKHAGPRREEGLKFTPGTERFMPPNALGALAEGRGAHAQLPGFTLVDGAHPWFIDDYVRGAIRAIVAAYPEQFVGVDLANAAPEMDRIG